MPGTDLEAGEPEVDAAHPVRRHVDHQRRLEEPASRSRRRVEEEKEVSGEEMSLRVREEGGRERERERREEIVW
eukprot:3434297-Rhodomonas_salina.1